MHSFSQSPQQPSLNGTVVGVLPAGFQYIRPYDAFVSMGPISGTPQMVERANHSGFAAVGRLKPGLSVETADREFKRIAADLEREYPKSNADVTARVERLADRAVAEIRLTLQALFGAVGFLLLIACVNVANLLITRGTARQHELAVRAAVGGSRVRLATQLLTESTLVSALGGALGIGVASALLRVLVAVAPEGTPRLDTVRLDHVALSFAVAAAAICGMLFGLFPAALAWRADGGASVLRLRSAGATAGSHRVRRALVVVETALAIILLTGAGLIARQRMSVIIFVTFAGVALVLAAVGLYGGVSQGVTERTHEIGVRMALGADRRHVLMLVVGQGVWMAIAGTTIGVVVAAALSRSIENLLFGVTPTDPATFVAVAILLLAVATIACWMPASRAARLDPTQALRSE